MVVVVIDCLYESVWACIITIITFFIFYSYMYVYMYVTVKDHMYTLNTMLVQSNHPMDTLMFEYHIEGFRGYSAHMNER